MTAAISVTPGLPPGRGHEAARLQPRNTVCATLDWPMPPEDAGGTVRPDVVVTLSQALASCGQVAFRCEDPPQGVESFPPHPSPLARLHDAARAWAGLANGPFTVALTPDPASIAALFADAGWPLGWQAALVLAPEADPAPAIAALRRGLDWRHRILPPGTRLLFGPGHDGTFAFAAATAPTWLAHLERSIQAPRSPDG